MGLAARHPVLVELLLAVFFSDAVSGNDSPKSGSGGKVEKTKSSYDSGDSSSIRGCLVLATVDFFCWLSGDRPVCIDAG